MFLCNWFWFVLQNVAKGQCLAWVRDAWLWRRALTLRSVMNNKNSWTLRNLIGISDVKFSNWHLSVSDPFIIRFIHYTSGRSPFLIHLTSVLSVKHPVEVRWWGYLPDLQRMYNGHVTDTKRKRNGRVPYKTDDYRTFNGHFIRWTSVQNFEHAKKFLPDRTEVDG